MIPAKRQSPRKCANTRKGQKNDLHLVVDGTTPELEVKGHRFSIARLRKSKIYLLGSKAEAEEILALLRCHPDPDAAAHIDHYEQRIERTQARLANVVLALSAAHAAILRLEGVQV